MERKIFYLYIFNFIYICIYNLEKIDSIEIIIFTVIAIFNK